MWVFFKFLKTAGEKKQYEDNKMVEKEKENKIVEKGEKEKKKDKQEVAWFIWSFWKTVSSFKSCWFRKQTSL